LVSKESLPSGGGWRTTSSVSDGSALTMFPRAAHTVGACPSRGKGSSTSVHQRHGHTLSIVTARGWCRSTSGSRSCTALDRYHIGSSPDGARPVHEWIHRCTSSTRSPCLRHEFFHTLNIDVHRTWTVFLPSH
jgi:hypothetical protein